MLNTMEIRQRNIHDETKKWKRVDDVEKPSKFLFLASQFFTWIEYGLTGRDHGKTEWVDFCCSVF